MIAQTEPFILTFEFDQNITQMRSIVNDVFIHKRKTKTDII